MAITLGTFKHQNDGSYKGTIKTLAVNAPLNIVPIEVFTKNAPDFRVYTGQNCEIGAAWSQVSQSSGEVYLNLRIAAPEFGPNWVRCRLVKLSETPGNGATHILLWEPKD